MHPQMNGYPSRELNGMPIPGGNSFSPDFSHSSSQQPLFATNNIGLNRPQQTSHPSQMPHNNQWLNSIPNNTMQRNHHASSQIPTHFVQQQPQFNPAWMNQMQQFSNGMTAMGFNPLFQQQLFQDALAMSQPVEAADEPLLVQTLLSAKKKKESYKEALNTLHGVSTTFQSLVPQAVQ